MEQDSTREYLRQLGVSDSVVAGGLEGLVADWERVVDEVAQGYQLDLDSYLNDLDLRQIIEEVVTFEEQNDPRTVERIELADKRMKSLIKPAGRCLWSDQVALEAGWTAEQNWWYFSRPIAAGRELLDELDRRPQPS